MQVMVKIANLLFNIKEKSALLMKLILTTVEFSRYKLSYLIYEHHLKLFGPSLDDFKIKEMLKQQGAEEK